MFDLQTVPLGINALLFAGAAAAVWWGGIKLAGFAREISERLGGHPALVGLLLLGAVASLPESATAVSAALLGHAPLAVNTLLGGIAVTLVIIAVIDAITGGEPLSVDVTHPILLLQATLTILLLTAVAIVMVTGDIAVPGAGVGLGSVLILVLYLASVLLVRRYERSDPWIPKRRRRSENLEHPAQAHRHASKSRLAFLCAAVAVLVISGGFVLAITGDAIAQQSGIGGSFVGFLLGGVSTSLPEFSTTLAAVRLRQYEMAFSDVFGTNLFSTMLLFFADLAHQGEPLLNVAGRFSLLAILLAIALTAIYLGGLIERRNFSVLRMGVDSLAVLVCYVAGLVLLFLLRQG